MDNASSRGARNAARVRLPNRADAVMHYEDFVRSIAFLGQREKNALIVAGDEVVDNLFTHGEIGRKGIYALVRRRAGGITLGLFVQSHGRFRDFATSLEGARPNGPRYNPKLGRWHGLGLTMCRNLARSVRYRAGERLDRVFLEFDLIPDR